LRGRWLEERNRTAVSAEVQKLTQRYRVYAPEPPKEFPP